jgi:hypothetical protein
MWRGTTYKGLSLRLHNSYLRHNRARMAFVGVVKAAKY